MYKQYVFSYIRALLKIDLQKKWLIFSPKLNVPAITMILSKYRRNERQTANNNTFLIFFCLIFKFLLFWSGKNDLLCNITKEYFFIGNFNF